jgi:hypothetical protein
MNSKLRRSGWGHIRIPSGHRLLTQTRYWYEHPPWQGRVYRDLDGAYYVQTKLEADNGHKGCLTTSIAAGMRLVDKAPEKAAR